MDFIKRERVSATGRLIGQDENRAVAQSQRCGIDCGLGAGDIDYPDLTGNFGGQEAAAPESVNSPAADGEFILALVDTPVAHAFPDYFNRIACAEFPEHVGA